jgi:uncharacterized protein (TIGR02588 family)
MKRPNKNAVEWSVFVASVVVVAAAVGYLGYTAVREKKTPPDLHITAFDPQATHSGHRVEVEVRNTGDQTAEQVRVEVALHRDEKEIERAELDIVFVPRKSSRRGWVTFRNDPRGCTVTTRAMSYETP